MNRYGIVLNKKIGDKVKKGEVLARVHANSKEKGEEAQKEILETYQFSQELEYKEETILGILS